MESLKKIIRQYIEAYNSLNIPKMISFFTEGCIFEHHSNSSSELKIKGLKDLEEVARESAQWFSKREQRITHEMIAQDEAAIQIKYHAILAQDHPNGWKAGKVLKLKGVSFFKFENEKIKKLTDFS